MSDSSTATRLDKIEGKLEVLGLEIRAGFADLRATVAEGRAAQVEFKTDLFARLDTLFGAVADLRTEYQNHVHPDPNA